MKIISELELKKMIELEKDNLVVRKDISDEKLKRFLSYYEFFTNNVIDLVGKEDKNTILYSKYYWYTKYKKDILKFMDMMLVLNKKGLSC